MKKKISKNSSKNLRQRKKCNNRIQTNISEVWADIQNSLLKYLFSDTSNESSGLSQLYST